MAKRPKPSSSAPRAAQAADATVSVAGAVLRVLGTILLIVLVTGLLFLCIFAYYVKNCLSTDLDVQLSDFTVSLSSSILYEDSDGNWQNLTNLSSTENRVWIDYADIPKDMEHAAVAIEDKRFYKHKGVDWYRTTGAFINMFLSMKNDFGGSTITQQLIKNLTKQDDITVQRKLLEIFQALEFEKSYDKEEIMEWYLNIVYFGEGCNGVYTAAETYFGKEPKDLTLAECASIIGITNNPSKYDPFISRENNKARQETILKQMYEQGYINKEQYDEAVAQELVFVRSESDDATQTIYSYYAEAVINDVLNDLVEQKGVSRDTARTLLYSGGYQVYSCYDPSIQQAIDDVYTDLDKMPQRPSASGQQFESAIVIMDPYTGEIKGLSGGTDKKTINFGTNRATQSKRPPGSSIKPIATYGPAMELGLITQYTQVNDAPDIKLSGTSWYPKNSDGGNLQFYPCESIAHFNSTRILMPQIESPRGIANLPAMLDAYADHISAVMIGPYDMSVMVGTPLDIYSDVMTASIQQVFDIARSYHKSCGIFCNTPDDAERFHKMGANVYWTGADVQFLQMGIDETFTRLAQIG